MPLPGGKPCGLARPTRLFDLRRKMGLQPRRNVPMGALLHEPRPELDKVIGELRLTAFARAYTEVGNGSALRSTRLAAWPTFGTLSIAAPSTDGSGAIVRTVAPTAEAPARKLKRILYWLRIDVVTARIGARLVRVSPCARSRADRARPRARVESSDPAPGASNGEHVEKGT